jgi:hypothetical protein
MCASVLLRIACVPAKPIDQLAAVSQPEFFTDDSEFVRYHGEAF